jgi:DNA-binding transcriptional MerR regulator
MKTVNEVLQETRISYPMLNRLKEFGIVPKPSRKGMGNRKGVVGIYEDEVIEVIKSVRAEQAKGYSLAQIAEVRRKEQSNIKIFEPTEEYLIPWQSSEAQSYVKAYDGLRVWVNKQIGEHNLPGYEFDSMKLEKVSRDNVLYLKPTEIEVKPRATSESQK